ncbi:MAG: hypothetical protein JJE18_04520 [Eubacteriaceae bacterium]|nr:hypothetical protein [Eubacteriaceae bacterium]
MATNTQEFERTDRALADTFNENLIVPINEMILEHNTHIADANVHVTLAKQTAWDGNAIDIATNTANISTLNTKATLATTHIETANIHVKITSGTANPTGGVNGDVYLQYV